MEILTILVSSNIHFKNRSCGSYSFFKPVVINFVFLLITCKGPVVKTFLRLFEEYPQSQEFFSDFRGTPLEALKDDHKLSTILQEHAIRVLRVVEKVIGRIEDLEKVYNFYLNTITKKDTQNVNITY